MQVQPDPCPFKNTLCREVHVQTRTRYTVEWKRRCLECGREIRLVEYSTSPITGILNEATRKHRTSVAAQWIAAEVRAMTRRAKRRSTTHATRITSTT